MMVLVIREHSASNLPAFKIVNHTPDFFLRFRQIHTSAHLVTRSVVRPASYVYFAWDDPSKLSTIEMVAVDPRGVESPCVSFSLEEVGISPHSFDVSGLNNFRKHLKAQVVVEGHTRVLVISNPETDPSGHKIQTNDTKSHLTPLYCTEFEFVLSRLSLSIIDEVLYESLLPLFFMTVCSSGSSGANRLRCRYNLSGLSFQLIHVGAVY